MSKISLPRPCKWPCSPFTFKILAETANGPERSNINNTDIQIQVTFYGVESVRNTPPLAKVPPAAFSGLSSLTSLSLTDSGVWSLPTESPFCPLTGLASLNLSGNSLTDVSALGFAATNELGACALPLADLDLSRNSIERLDRESFGRLSKLERLDLSGNAISAVETSALDSLPALKTLRLSSNGLRALPPHLFRESKDLRELHLQNNSLAALPADLFSGLRHLVVLNVSRNALADNSLSGETFGALLRLVALDMSGNGLTGLPAGLLSPLTSLQLLDLSGNQLHEVGGAEAVRGEG